MSDVNELDECVTHLAAFGFRSMGLFKKHIYSYLNNFALGYAPDLKEFGILLGDK